MPHKIEILSAGCQLCSDTIETVRKLAGHSHEVLVRDMQQQDIAEAAAKQGVRQVPAVLIDGKLAGCCRHEGIDENLIREALA